ncbi:E3 ubiquitin/ISG15 ligase TRIM25-like [Pelobates fuscus]|uniref:E3 ubiquitin/ISG15 ligase TRIM25-like n=1 Tax=Pelobates fuscus TaxID=191477 RepID=UPI002FE4B121
MASADLRDELTCSICLNIYTDPVTLTCGHSFCRICIGNMLDTQEGPGMYTCPECRERFGNCPELKRNLRLCNIAKHFSSNEETMRKAGISCTYCADFPAVKTCLHCEASLCESHLKGHSQSAEHVLTEPISSIRNRKCFTHKEILKYYCSEDAVCICASCGLIGEHRGHMVETLTEASDKKRQEMRNILERLTSKREEAGKSIQSLQELRRDLEEKSAVVTKKVSITIRDIKEQLEALNMSILGVISQQKEQVSLRVSDRIRQLEIKKEKLSRKMGQVEELCNMTDPLTVLQGRESDSADYCDTVEEEDKENDIHSERDMDMDLILETLNTGLADIVAGVKRRYNVLDATDKSVDVKVDSDMSLDVKPVSHKLLDVNTTSESLPDVSTASDIILDINTASNNVDISCDLKTVSWAATRSNRPYLPERFYFPQVLSSQSFSSGQHCWEVEGSESGRWLVGMTYPSIDRNKHLQSAIGDNNKSWGLERVDNHQYSVRHDSKEIHLHFKPSCQKIRIHLNYKSGRLSFYELCEPIRHLHTFTATFTEPLHVAFWVFVHDSLGEQRSSWVRILN